MLRLPTRSALLSAQLSPSPAALSQRCPVRKRPDHPGNVGYRRGRVSAIRNGDSADIDDVCGSVGVAGTVAGVVQHQGLKALAPFWDVRIPGFRVGLCVWFDSGGLAVPGMAVAR